MKAYSYESVQLLDTKGEIILALGVQHDSPEVRETLLSAALRSGDMQSSDLFLDKNGGAWLDIVVPLSGMASDSLVNVHSHNSTDSFGVPREWPCLCPCFQQ